MRLASLPWYDLPETRGLTDAWWELLAEHLRAAGVAGVPARLERDLPCERQWSSGRLLFSQACGYDARISMRGHLALVATPRYSAPGCVGASYSSVVVLRADHPARALEELRGARCVINTRTSHSGMNILRAMVAPLKSGGRFFESVRVSGAHARSLDALREGHADVAAIDCVTLALVGRHRPAALRGLRYLCGTPQVAAPPYVTDAATSPRELERLRAGLAAALADPAGAALRAELFLDGCEALPLAAYDAISELEELARALGYREIRPDLPAQPDETADRYDPGPPMAAPARLAP